MPIKSNFKEKCHPIYDIPISRWRRFQEILEELQVELEKPNQDQSDLNRDSDQSEVGIISKS